MKPMKKLYILSILFVVSCASSPKQAKADMTGINISPVSQEYFESTHGCFGIINAHSKKEFKFLGITSDPKLLINKDLKTEGRYRDINLLIEPFNLNAHYEEINESKNGIEDNVNLNIYNSTITNIMCSDKQTKRKAPRKNMLWLS